jgi:hypothetical protein
MSHHLVRGHSFFLSLFPRVVQKFVLSQIQDSCVKSSNRYLCLLGGWVQLPVLFVSLCIVRVNGWKSCC